MSTWRLWYCDDVEAWLDREISDDGAEAASDEVAGDGGANAAADGIAEAAVGQIVRPGGEVNHWTARSLTVAHYRLEVSTAAQALDVPDGQWRPRRIHDGWELNGQSRSTARPPTSQHMATVLGGHAMTEPVLSLSRDPFRLPGSLGHGSLRSGAACTSRCLDRQENGVSRVDKYRRGSDGGQSDLAV